MVQKQYCLQEKYTEQHIRKEGRDVSKTLRKEKKKIAIRHWDGASEQRNASNLPGEQVKGLDQLLENRHSASGGKITVTGFARSSHGCESFSTREAEAATPSSVETFRGHSDGEFICLHRDPYTRGQQRHLNKAWETRDTAVRIIQNIIYLIIHNETISVIWKHGPNHRCNKKHPSQQAQKSSAKDPGPPPAPCNRQTEPACTWRD